MNRPLFVSFYTPDYKARAMALIRSLKKFGLEYDVRSVEDLGSWQKNTQYKPKFLWQMMVENYSKASNNGRPIVWIDSDAEVLRDLADFWGMEDSCDLAVCEWKHPNVDKIEVLSGTVYLANNVRSHRLVDAWIEECAANPELWDQRCLRKALKRFTGEQLRVKFLPVEFCFIFDIHKALYPNLIPSIVHYQASRVTKQVKP